jgi:hypothetical protein
VPQSATLEELRQAVGPYPWRTEQVNASSGKPISEEMTLLLSLVIFDGYDLFKLMPDIIPPNAPLDALYREGGKREFPRESAAGIIKSLNQCHDANQKLITANSELRQEIAQKMNLKLRNQIVAMVVAVILARLPEIYQWLRSWIF